MTWIEGLTPGERSQWDAFVEHFRRDALQKIGGSAAFVSILPAGDNVDVQFAAEIGTAIMLDKPILAITGPGRPISDKLRHVADIVVEADVDTEDGRDVIAAAIRRLAEVPR